MLTWWPSPRGWAGSHPCWPAAGGGWPPPAASERPPRLCSDIVIVMIRSMINDHCHSPDIQQTPGIPGCPGDGQPHDLKHHDVMIMVWLSSVCADLCRCHSQWPAPPSPPPPAGSGRSAPAAARPALLQILTQGVKGMESVSLYLS